MEEMGKKTCEKENSFGDVAIATATSCAMVYFYYKGFILFTKTFASVIDKLKK